ncbi:FAD-binding dehydrogenase [Streptomyces aureus]|uniref:FAD-binding dehydrogenase n=1 Tax=Streptomyces aureus TaxID=193461 RepID=UPI0036459B10
MGDRPRPRRALRAPGQGGVARGLVELKFRHRVTGLSRSAGAVDTVTGEILEPSSIERGQGSSRTVTGSFELKAQAVIVTSGGIGGNHDLVRANWPERLGTPPEKMLSGVPAHVDGLMLGITENAGAHLINRDRMWHYTEGIENWNPIWDKHGIRILPGPSSLWLDARGERLPVPLFPGFDTLGTLDHIMKTGYGYTWFVLNQRIIGKEFTLSGSEQNPDLTGKSVRGVIDRARADVPAPVKAFMDHGADFVIEKDLPALVRGMNALAEKSSGPLIDEAALRSTLVARDREIVNPFTKDLQVTAIRGTRKFLGDRLIRTAAPHRILDPKAGPLVAVRLNILTRKSLGGLETDLSSRVLTEGGEPLPGVYAAGEAAGFGGGGVHGYRSLEGTFLGGCLFSGRTAGRAAAAATG